MKKAIREYAEKLIPRVRRCRLSKSARGCPQCSQTARWPLGTLLGEGRERDCPTCTRPLDGTLDANHVLIFQFAKKGALDKAWADDIKPWRCAKVEPVAVRLHW